MPHCHVAQLKSLAPQREVEDDRKLDRKRDEGDREPRRFATCWTF